MSKHPSVDELREATDGFQSPISKEDDETSGSGSFHDHADMHRLGKEQELKVCSLNYLPLT